MRVEEVMSSAKCCSASDTVRDCARMMKEENIGFVPVCDPKGKPVGAVTDRDLVVRVLADSRTGDDKIEPFVTRNVISCRVGDDVADAERLMRESRVSRIMVCDDQGKLKGVISLQDLAQAESDEATGHTFTEVKSDQAPMH